MDCSLDEQLLLTEFRRLSPSEKQELIDFALSLAKQRSEAQPAGQCRLEAKECRPEASKEPLFTE